MWRAVIIAAVLVTPVFAQQPDIATLQKAILVLQAQRNQAMDALANLEVQRAMLAEEVEKLKARIDELQKKNRAPPEGSTK